MDPITEPYKFLAIKTVATIKPCVVSENGVVVVVGSEEAVEERSICSPPACYVKL